MATMTMNVMNGSGDQEIKWDPEDPDSKAEAKGKIKALQEEGYKFYIEGSREDDVSTIVDNRIKTRKVVAVAPMAGG